MRRDRDLIRNMLLRFEEADTDKVALVEARDLAGRDVLTGHIRLLEDSAFIEAVPVYKSLDHTDYDDVWRVTTAGHDFLDSIRDPEIWRKTKEGADKLGGWTLKTLADLATGFIRVKATELGLPL